MKKEDKSNLVGEGEEERNESNENGYVGDKETPTKSTTVRLCGNWKLEGLTLVILVVVIFSVAVTVAMVIHILVGPPQVVPHGAAASTSPLCSKAAVEVMHKKGGNAVDGAVAAALCESVTLAHATGLGGGALMFVYSQTRRNATLFDCREAAPGSSSANMFKGKHKQATSGGKSVAVPGFLRCLHTAHQQFGKAAWAELVKPAIYVAKNGFPMPQDLHDRLLSDKKVMKKVKDSPVLAKVYLTSNKSSPVAPGSIIKRPKFATVLENIAKKGDTVLYSGNLAKEIVNEVKTKNGIMTAADLSSYATKNPDPLTGHFNHFTMITFPLPSIGGPVLLGTLNALDAYGIYRSLLPNETSIPHQVKAPDVVYYHRLVEILRYNLNEATKVGASSNASLVASHFTDVNAAKKLVGSIQSNTSATLTGKAVAPLFSLASGDSHLSVQGPDNTIVSLSSSLGGIFGSGVVTSSGIVLNNAMGAFSLPDVTPTNSDNLPGPNKRPLSPLSPFIAHNPRRRCGVRFGAGSSGGLDAPQAAAQVAIAALLWDVPKCREKDCINLQVAIRRSRLAVKPTVKEVKVEPGIPVNSINFLKAAGLTVKDTKIIGGVQAAGEVQHIVTAYSDQRQGGEASHF